MHSHGFMVLNSAGADSVAVCTVQKQTKKGLPSPQLYSPGFILAASPQSHTYRAKQRRACGHAVLVQQCTESSADMWQILCLKGQHASVAAERAHSIEMCMVHAPSKIQQPSMYLTGVHCWPVRHSSIQACPCQRITVKHDNIDAL